MSSYKRHAALFAGKWAAQEARRAAPGWGDNLAPDTGVVQPAERTMSGGVESRHAASPARQGPTGRRTETAAVGVAPGPLTHDSWALPAPIPAPSKFGNVKTDGYASRREAKRAAVLRLLQDTKVISNLREQVEFVLIPRQLDEHGKVAERACIYRADFVYTDNATGRQIVEDSKGVRTADYVIKRKLMRFTHGIVVRET